jgi:hypothetical protein
VEYSQDFDRAFFHLIHGNIRQGRKGKVAASVHPALAGPLYGNCASCPQPSYRFRHAAGCFGIVALNPFANALYIVGGRR